MVISSGQARSPKLVSQIQSAGFTEVCQAVLAIDSIVQEQRRIAHLGKAVEGSRVDSHLQEGDSLVHVTAGQKPLYSSH